MTPWAARLVRLARRLVPLLALSSARAVALSPADIDVRVAEAVGDPYSIAEHNAGPRGSGNSIDSPKYNTFGNPLAGDIRKIGEEFYMPTSDGGMAVIDPTEAGNAYDRITESENGLTPLAGPGGAGAGFMSSSFQQGVGAITEQYGAITNDGAITEQYGEHPVKGYGERNHKGPFRVFSNKLNCDAYVYALGCGGRSRGPPNSAAHCIWCVSVDVCVQGDIKTGPDAVGLATLASKGVGCDSWLTTQI